jgi:hypothetical protein
LEHAPIDLTRSRGNNGVTRGLDPRAHLLRIVHFAKKMDCRVKPGNDAEQIAPYGIKTAH